MADPFDIRAHVPEYEAIVSGYLEASFATRRRLASRLNVPYGEHPDETLDLFFPGRKAGEGITHSRALHIFVHGGYWHKFQKETYSFVAESIVHQGAIAAILDFSRLPAARIGTLIGQVRRAAIWLRDQAHEFDADPLRISASGHSAGAHLATYLVCRGPHEQREVSGPVRSVLLISGLSDLAPVARSFLQPTLALTAEEIIEWSPCSAIPLAGVPVQVAVGACETEPYLQAADDLVKRFRQAGCACKMVRVADENHMTMIRSFGDPEGVCARLLQADLAAT